MGINFVLFHQGNVMERGGESGEGVFLGVGNQRLLRGEGRKMACGGMFI